ncbi:hypothetical protein DO73_4640 [Burkholderia pseudomallei]|nr:hypothetical protein DO73_4640 [Burkholderia pseudomallei]
MKLLQFPRRVHVGRADSSPAPYAGPGEIRDVAPRLADAAIT